MQPRPIRNALEHEHIVAVEPEPGLRHDEVWQRRLHLFTGRTLSDRALENEQQGRAGRLAMMGQALARGVGSGLGVSLIAPGLGETGSLLVEVGRGVTASGEDVVVPHALRVPLDSLLVDASALVADANGVQRRPTLAELRASDATAPEVAILTLEPIQAGRVGDFDDTDPCSRDAESEAFEDHQWVDGAQLVLQMWPDSSLLQPVRGPRWRNRIAAALFAHETSLAAGEAPAWSRLGLAIAVVAFNETGAALFVDQGSVVRIGGRPRLAHLELAVAGPAAVQQARISQFSEHVTALLEAGRTLEQAGSELRTLPPIGLLPMDALDLESRRVRFFPADHAIDAAPIPLEQLPLAFRESAPLAPFDLLTPDRVQLLVPVPQAVFDPKLLEIELEDPIFQEKIAEFQGERDQWRGRRDDVRRKHDALLRAIDGEAPEREDDTAAQDDEIAAAIVGDGEEAYGTTGSADALEVEAVTTLVSDLTRAGSRLRSEVLHSADGEERNRILDLGLEGFIEFLEDKVKRSDDTVDLGFLRAQTDIYRLRQLVLGTDAASKLAVNPALASIAQGVSAAASKRDVADFLERAKRPTAQPAAPVRVTRAAPSRARAEAFSAGPEPEEEVSSVRRTVRATPRDARRAAARPDSREALFGAERERASALEAVGRLDRLQPDSPLLLADVGAVRLPPERGAARDDVLDAAPLIGVTGDFRHVTVGARLEESPAPASKSSALAAKIDLVQSIGGLGIDLGDFTVPGRSEAGERLDHAFGGDSGLLQNPDALLVDPAPEEEDEASYFSHAVRVIDETVFTLRTLEGRVKSYRRAIDQCRRALAELRDLAEDAALRLETLDSELAETRHDVAVAGSLREEELAGIEALNRKRVEIIEEHAPYLVFRRPRLSGAFRSLPSRVLDPLHVEAVLPACAGREIEAPPELGDMIEVLKEAPVRWFPHARPAFSGLDRVALLRTTLEAARTRAIRFTTPATGSLRLPSAASPPASFRVAHVASSIQQTLQARKQVMSRHRLKTARFELRTLDALSFQGARKQAEEVVSLGDLMDAGHGRTRIAQAVARELENVSRVAACLYAGFGEAPPELRLTWAELFSQFDDPVRLRRLSRLPRFAELERGARRELQALVDWLYGRIDANEPDAVALIDDLVRVCLLLASHAPISQIVAGHVPEETPVKPGGSVEVVVDPRRVRIGMDVLIFQGNRAVVRGVVDDLTADRARARVVGSTGQNLRIAQNAKVHFAESRAFERNLGSLGGSKGLGAGQLGGIPGLR